MLGQTQRWAINGYVGTQRQIMRISSGSPTSSSLRSIKQPRGIFNTGVAFWLLCVLGEWWVELESAVQFLVPGHKNRNISAGTHDTPVSTNFNCTGWPYFSKSEIAYLRSHTQSGLEPFAPPGKGLQAGLHLALFREANPVNNR